MNPIRIGVLNFESVVNQVEIPVLLAFGAEWDYDSYKTFETVKQIAKEYDQKLQIGLVDYDYAPDVFHDCGITDIPTLIIYEDGKEFNRKVGYDGFRSIYGFLDHFFGVLPY